MGPLMVVGSYFAVTGSFDANLLVVSLPVGLLVTAILHGNEWRDVAQGTRHGLSTVSAPGGPGAAHLGYVLLVLGAHVAVRPAGQGGGLAPTPLPVPLWPPPLC